SSSLDVGDVGEVVANGLSAGQRADCQFLDGAQRGSDEGGLGDACQTVARQPQFLQVLYPVGGEQGSEASVCNDVVVEVQPDQAGSVGRPRQDADAVVANPVGRQG